jgi:hypothetical protein
LGEELFQFLDHPELPGRAQSCVYGKQGIGADLLARAKSNPSASICL